VTKGIYVERRTLSTTFDRKRDKRKVSRNATRPNQFAVI
jgi:hypothetical protein